MAKYLKYAAGQCIADDLQAPVIKGYAEAVTVSNSSSAYTVNIDAATILVLTLNSASVTLIFPSPAAGKSFVMMIRWSTAAATITWPATVKWPNATAPVLTGMVTKSDNIGFWSDGTNWYGSLMGQKYTV
jgi:hypothetical protein